MTRRARAWLIPTFICKMSVANQKVFANGLNQFIVSHSLLGFLNESLFRNGRK